MRYMKTHQTREILGPTHPTPATRCTVVRTTSSPHTQPKPPEPLFFKRVGCGFICVKGEAYRMSWGLGKPAGGRGVPTVGGGARVPLGSGTPQPQVWLFQEKEIENIAEEAATGPAAGYLRVGFRL